MTALTQQDIDNIKYVASLSQPGEERELDFSDDRQWAYFMAQVARSGVTEETHPEYMKALAQARAEDKKRGGPSGRLQERKQAVAAATSDTMHDANTISTFGMNTAKTATLGATYSAIVNGTVFTSLYVQLMDVSTDKLLGENNVGPVYGEGEYIPIYLTGSVPDAHPAGIPSGSEALARKAVRTGRLTAALTPSTARTPGGRGRGGRRRCRRGGGSCLRCGCWDRRRCTRGISSDGARDRRDRGA